MTNVIPGGIVIFFPSYDYEDFVFSYFNDKKIIDRLNSKKRVYREPKKSSELDKVWSDYCKSVKIGSGAILFCVVGGKMSEGINFSDDLGRCVIMVGLPYPNKHSPELKEKMNYLNEHYVSFLSYYYYLSFFQFTFFQPSTSDGTKAGSIFYENLCFKAVNQSIGRSIRHKLVKNINDSKLLANSHYF